MKMTENKLKTRLSRRLEALYRCIPQDSDLLYDLCCDHGAIGRAILESRSHCHVVFNDVQAEIMLSLAKLLSTFSVNNYTLNTGPAENIIIQKAKKPTILLAGIGDEQCIKILTKLLNQPHSHNAHYIISPATKTFNVRSFLTNKNANLIHEQTVFENNRLYEIIEITTGHLPNAIRVHPFGHCWEHGNIQQQVHLKKIIQFYSGQKKRQNEEQQHIVEGYKQILKNIS